MAETVPEGDAELNAGQQQAGEGVPALASLIEASTAGDLALDHLWAQVAPQGKFGLMQIFSITKRNFCCFYKCNEE
jgi:hypothetical protein